MKYFSSFKFEKLSNFATIEPGFPFKSDNYTDNADDIPLVKGENVQQGFIDWSIAKFWPNFDKENYTKYQLDAGDIVLAMDRPWVEAGLKWAYIKKRDPKSLLVQRVARLRSNPGLDQAYLRCLISSSYFSSYIQPIVTGVNVPHISGKQIGDFKIPLPPVSIQKKIAAILTAYDDLIENNQRRIALLEKMAEELYREWFVRLRFPGHEHVKIEKGVPEGWRVASLKDFCLLVTDGTHDTPKEAPEGFFLATGKNLKNGTVDFSGAYKISEQDHDLIKKRSGIKEWDILFSNIGTLGSLALVSDFVDYSVKNIIIFRAKDAAHACYLFSLLKLKSIVETMQMISSGASQQFIGLGTARNFKIFHPGHELVSKFGVHTVPIQSKIQTLHRINQKLELERNSLLPRLISGKLSVEDLNIALPPSMQEAS